MIQLMEILRIYVGEQWLIKYYLVKASIILKNQKYDGYQYGPASVVYNFFNKRL